MWGVAAASRGLPHHTVAQGHSGSGSRPGLALGPPAQRRVWVELQSGEQTKPSLAAEPSSVYFILFFKGKASFWYLFVIAAISWTLIKLPLATASICFQGLFLSGVFLKTSELKHKQHAAMKPLPAGLLSLQGGHLAGVLVRRRRAVPGQCSSVG